MNTATFVSIALAFILIAGAIIYALSPSPTSLPSAPANQDPFAPLQQVATRLFLLGLTLSLLLIGGIFRVSFALDRIADALRASNADHLKTRLAKIEQHLNLNA